jgi:2-amino-4-hydroxy-6-hydroxymethyldihydropteridine diphosphokinase
VKYDLYLSLGSNNDPRDFYLRKAVLLLKEHFELIRLSSIYITKPMYDLDQEEFYNICAYYKTDIDDAFTILEITRKIENQIGRNKVPDRPKGPRNIDIDIILYSDFKILSDNLNIPHKLFHERNFVLIPMLEIIGKNDLLKKREIKNLIIKNKDQIVEKSGVLQLE